MKKIYQPEKSIYIPQKKSLWGKIKENAKV